MAKKYIDAEWLHSHFKEAGDEETKTNFEQMMHRWIDIAPAADVAPVVHARWMNHGALYKCSNCGNLDSYGDTLYCPKCGARMDALEPEKLSVEELKQVIEAAVKNKTEQAERYYYLYPGTGDNK